MNINDPALYDLDTTQEVISYEDYLLETYDGLSPDAQRILRQVSASRHVNLHSWGQMYIRVELPEHHELIESGLVDVGVYGRVRRFTLTSLGRAVALAYWRAVDMRVKAYMCAEWFEDIPF